MWRFLSVIVAIVLIPLPSWCIPQYDQPSLTDIGIVPIPASNAPSTLAVPDTIPDFFDSVWIAEYNSAKSLGIDEETAQLKAYSAWHEFNTDPAIFVMTKPIQEAINAASKHKGKTVSSKEKTTPSPKPSKDEGSSGEVGMVVFTAAIKYDGSNMYAVSDDINANREVISFNRVKPETILKQYHVPEYTTDYLILLQWIEEHLYEAVRVLAIRQNMHGI